LTLLPSGADIVKVVHILAVSTILLASSPLRFNYE
jgi:hypothetical protein